MFWHQDRIVTFCCFAVAAFPLAMFFSMLRWIVPWTILVWVSFFDAEPGIASALEFRLSSASTVTLSV